MTTEREVVPEPPDAPDEPDRSRQLPRWVIPATAVFWGGFLAAIAVRFFWTKLSDLVVLLFVSVFLSLAIEPGVNRLARRGWRRGTATALILFGVIFAFILFVVAIGTLVASQVADLLSNSEEYIRDTVKFLNDTFGANLDAQEVIDDFNDPNGRVQEFVRDQQDNVVRLSVAALGGLLALFSVLLFTFYLVADGPKMRRAICSRLTPARQERVLATWELAGTKTGGYLYSRALLALLSTVFHWIVFQSVGTAAPVALALWVGIVSQFLPVVGTYLAGVLPVLLTFLDSPLKAVIVLIAIVLYQQIENYLFAPRITARTMELHPALAFGAALGGAAVLGAIGAVLALPAAAMAQALVSEVGARHDVIKSDLTEVRHHRVWKNAPPGSDEPETRGSGGGEGVPRPRRPLARSHRRATVIMDPRAFVPVAVTDRSGFEESLHHGVVVALGPDGDVAWSAGDPDVVVYPRSALKPLQAAAMVELGLVADDAELALVCASHDGCPEHVAVVRRLLAGAGLTERELANTPTMPINAMAADHVVRAGGGPSSILQNCSGKHAGMMATASVNGWSVEGYCVPSHPLQAAILDHLGSVAGPVAHVGIDGCGAPAAAMALSALACAVRDLAVSRHPTHRAMTTHPHLVGGSDRDVTRLMRAVPGLMAKDGAEGVYVAALPDGRAVALKIADGASRARLPVMVAALARLGVDVPSESLREPVLGHGRDVGSVRALVGP